MHFVIGLWDILRTLKNPYSSSGMKGRNPETGRKVPFQRKQLHFPLLQIELQRLQILSVWFWNLMKKKKKKKKLPQWKELIF